MRIAVFIAFGLLVAMFLFVWLISCIRYQIGSRHFKIKLFGLCLRRIPLEDIHYITKRRPAGLAENWWNTMRPNHRMLIIRRYRGLCRNVIITPRNRYVLKAELEKAVKRAGLTLASEPDSLPLVSE